MLKLLTVACLFACCVLVASSNLSSISKCLPSLGKYPFDEQKFSGDWYAVASVIKPPKAEAIKCSKIHYSSQQVGNVTRTNINVNLKKSDGSEKVVEGRGQAVKPGYNSATLMAYKVKSEDKWHNIVKQAIVATDYETYALVHGCKEDYDDKADMFNKHLYNQIWSRSKTINQDTLKTLKSVMSSFDINDDEWELIDNSKC